MSSKTAKLQATVLSFVTLQRMHVQHSNGLRLVENIAPYNLESILITNREPGGQCASVNPILCQNHTLGM